MQTRIYIYISLMYALMRLQLPFGVQQSAQRRKKSLKCQKLHSRTLSNSSSSARMSSTSSSAPTAVTAIAGHRPCFFSRNEDNRFNIFQNSRHDSESYLCSKLPPGAVYKSCLCPNCPRGQFMSHTYVPNCPRGQFPSHAHVQTAPGGSL